MDKNYISESIDENYNNNHDQSPSKRQSNISPLESLNLNNLNLSNIGPNVNIKQPKNTNRSTEQKEFFKRKIHNTKKTELCKNWELFGDCYYKDKCSFAHGDSELRNKILVKFKENEKFKTKPCRSFEEKGYCPFGNRCQYTHIVSQNRLLSYQAINFKMANEIFKEGMKEENENLEFVKLLEKMNQKRNNKL